MRMVIEVAAFSDQTERVVAEETVPWCWLDSVLRILGLPSADAFRGGFELNAAQRREFALLLDTHGVASAIDYSDESGVSVFLAPAADR